MNGIYGKYIISKADGSAIDPDACYFVLRLDTDDAARRAVMEYARCCNDERLAGDLTKAVVELDEGAGGVFSDVWRATPCPQSSV